MSDPRHLRKAILVLALAALPTSPALARAVPTGNVPQDVRDHRIVTQLLQQERASKVLPSDGHWIFRYLRHSADQNGLGQSAGKVLPSDGHWIFRYLRHSADQNGLGQSAGKVLPSDGRWIFRYLRHSAGQNSVVQSQGQGKYGPLDPWAYRIPHRQNAKEQATASRVNAAGASVKAIGFDWGDAAIGAAAAILVMLLLAGGLAARRRRILADAHL